MGSKDISIRGHVPYGPHTRGVFLFLSSIPKNPKELTISDPTREERARRGRTRVESLDSTDGLDACTAAPPKAY